MHAEIEFGVVRYFYRCNFGFGRAFICFNAVGFNKIYAIFAAFEGKSSIIVTHHDETCAFAFHGFAVFLAGCKLNFGSGCEVLSGELLQQHVGHII